MPGNSAHTTNEQTGAAWQLGWRAVGTWLAVLFLALLAWVYFWMVGHFDPVHRLNAGEALVFAGLHAGLALALERALAGTPLRRAWRYRMAFLVSASVALAYWPAQWFFQGGSPHPSATLFQLLIWPAAGLLGAQLGSLAATGLNESLWEDNFPPSARVQAEVFACHQQIFGEAPATWPFTSKRLFDILLALAGLVCSAPLWLVMMLLLWLEDPGPILFVKNSVGRHGRNFHQFKFRTMVRGAEENTGPVLAQELDGRVLRIGRLLRKTALDELPQLLNILRGEMSFVGPRPQRTVLVHRYLEGMPEYAERHRVAPGLAGLAQVAGDYYLTPRQKLRFDRLYIRYESLGFDLKLLVLAFLITFWFRWQKNWNGRLPRRLLH